MPSLHTPLSLKETETFVEPSEGKVTVSTLANGLKVASVDYRGNLSSVGVFLNAGSRDETDTTRGATQLLRHGALKGTDARTGFRLIRELERMGANVTASAQHELLVYSGDVLRPMGTTLVETLGECLLYPSLKDWDVEDAAKLAGREAENLKKNAPAQLIELMHSAAYGGQSLGQPLYLKKDDYLALHRTELLEFMQANLAHDTLCVAGVNVDHAELVHTAEATFSSLPSNRPVNRAVAEYTGGDFRTESDSATTMVGLAFQGAPWTSDRIVHVSLLQTLMGGGSAFSAGGPGKGMLSRLYTNVLNRYHEVTAANVFNMFYSDSGVFGVYGETTGPLAGVLVDVLTKELHGMAATIGHEELARAKNQLKGSILMNVEQPGVLLDDVGRQVIALSRHHAPRDLCAKVDAITATELTGVAQQLLKTPLTFVASGNIQKIPRFDIIASRFK